MLLRLPFPREALRLGHLVGAHSCLDIVAGAYQRVEILARRRARYGKAVPLVRPHIVLGNAIGNAKALGIYEAEGELSRGIPLLGKGIIGS